MGQVLQAKKVFEPIHQGVSIDQKTVVYRPTDKLVFAVIGMLSGAQTVSEINTTVRPDTVLLNAFGITINSTVVSLSVYYDRVNSYSRCADISVIQQTLDAATETTVSELEAALNRIREPHTQTNSDGVGAGDVLCVDMDLSALPVSKRAEGAERGYVAKQKNQYTRQLARVVVSETQEIVSHALYSGTTRSDAVFKTMVGKLETTLHLDTREKRGRVQLRFDAGFGTDANLNYALWRGYQVVGKMYAWQRAKKLAKSVETWAAVPTRKGIPGREAGWVSKPHRYGRNTVQVAVRTPKKDGTWSYAVLVTTKTDASVAEIVREYDKRSGAPESSFSQDYEALSLRKYRKSGFVAQQVLVLLAQLAHNVLIWLKGWLTKALAPRRGCGEKVAVHRARTRQTVEVRGLKRLRRDLLSIPGQVCFEGKRVVGIRLNPLYPLIHHVTTALEALFKPYNIRVLLDKN